MTVFVDASFLIALFHTKDDFHAKAREIIQKIEKNSVRPVASNIVVAEVVNFIFRLKGPKVAKKLLEFIKKSGIKEIFVPPEIFQEAQAILFAQKSKRGLNFFDCLHLATMRSFKIKKILTFDQAFEKEVEVVGGIERKILKRVQDDATGYIGEN